MDTENSPDSLHHEVLAIATRNERVERIHRGSVVVVGGSGDVRLAVGTPEVVTFGRSCHKPLQLLAMLRSGLVLRGDASLAIAMSSHSGSALHIALVRVLLEGAGLDAAALRNVAAYPIGERERDDWVRAGRGPERISMNCSGKHAAMLAACVHNGWPIEDYLEIGHPLQRAVADAVADLTGERPFMGVDGCGAPTPATSLTGLARAFSRLALGAAGTHEAMIATAIRREPIALGGVDRPVTELLAAAPGWIGKDGAAGVFAAALPDGTAVAVKLADGLGEPTIPVALAALEAAGVAVPPSLDGLRAVDVLGGGVPVGVLSAMTFS